ncbi:DoxX-like family protein [Sphingobacterium lactis]|uniref:DoxX-like family protein n=1 Tax=Sphingobacterium lactis TaxID=797291 RepID=UPI003DA6811E
MHRALTIFIAVVWFVNGFICKILNLVPRHEEIVARILGGEHARILTIGIGVAEVCMAIWVLSGKWRRTCALLQIFTVASMNILEFILVPDLLLWGRFNILFAFLFIVVVYYHAFGQQWKTPKTQSV